MKIDVRLTEADLAQQLRADALRGLTADPKWLPPKWFYDATGSKLFERITELEEYYPTRAERAILVERAGEIARISGAKTLVELGSGSSEKTRLLLDALRRQGGWAQRAGGREKPSTLGRFVPLDVSESALREAAHALDREYPGIEVHAIVADFTAHLDAIPAGDGRMVAFLGGTIGNLMPAERAEFFGRLRGELEAGEWLLLGTDLVKDRATLIDAYDDAAGVTAEFNRNVLRVLNRDLVADFPVDEFDHVAVWDDTHEWIEMRLRATRDMAVRVGALDLDLAFGEGEEMRTEISAKFRREGVAAELDRAGFGVHRWWTDPEGRFALSLAAAV